MLIEAKIQVSGKERKEAFRRVSSFIASRPLHEIALFLFAQAFFRVWFPQILTYFFTKIFLSAGLNKQAESLRDSRCLYSKLMPF